MKGSSEGMSNKQIYRQKGKPDLRRTHDPDNEQMSTQKRGIVYVNHGPSGIRYFVLTNYLLTSYVVTYLVHLFLL